MLWTLLLLLPAIVLLGLLRWLGGLLERRPEHRPSTFVPDDRPVLALLGDSHTMGRIGGDWASSLARALPGWNVVNAGINGETAQNVRARVPQVLACSPVHAVVLVGTNDVIGGLNDAWEAMFLKSGALAAPATLEGYEADLAGLVADLGDVPTCLVTLPPLDDDPTSPAGLRLAEHDAVVHAVAQRTGTPLLPLREALTAWHPPGAALSWGMGAVVWRMYSALFRHHALGHSWDRIAGGSCTVDGIHLSDRAAGDLQGLVVDHLRQAGVRSP